MKTLIALAVTIAALSTNVAQARTAQYMTIDLTGKHFQDDGFNLMGDENPSAPGDGSWDGIQLKLAGVYNRDFTVAVTASNPEDKSCGISSFKVEGRSSLVRIEASPDTDSGDTCDFAIRYKNGRKATLKVESTGT